MGGKGPPSLCPYQTGSTNSLKSYERFAKAYRLKETKRKLFGLTLGTFPNPVGILENLLSGLCLQ